MPHTVKKELNGRTLSEQLPFYLFKLLEFCKNAAKTESFKTTNVMGKED